MLSIVRSISKNEIIRCYKFAEDIIKQDNQYNRFQQSQETQILRTYIGKLAEYIFLNYLKSQGINYPEGDMFTIFSGQTNVDSFDFITPQGKYVDIKTASRSFHTRIMIPIDQFELRKDYYVGIKLHFKEFEENIIYNNINQATIYGYIDRATMESRPTEYFGEGDCKSIKLTQLYDIKILLSKFQK